MNYCTVCHSSYTQPGTCNCFAPVRTWTSYGAAFVRVACSGCEKICCDHSSTACPPSVETTITVSGNFDINNPAFNYNPLDWDASGTWIPKGTGL